MTKDIDIRRNQLKAILEKAQVEVKSALDSVDEMGPYELAEITGSAAALAAFFDKNGSCAAPAIDIKKAAVFDKNGSCAAEVLKNFDAAAFFDKNGSC